MKGLYLIDGPDGVGKTTLLKQLAFTYKDALFYKEPGGTEKAEEISRLIRSFSDNDSARDVFLFFAARYDFWRNELKKNIDGGKLIFVDRSIISTFVYQYFSVAEEKREKFILDLITDAYMHLLSKTKIKPNYVLLTASKDVVRQRIIERGVDISDRFEKNIERTVNAYGEAAIYLESKGWKIVYLDAEKKVEDMVVDIGSTL